jgi:GT2 family glycosyltransferase
MIEKDLIVIIVTQNRPKVLNRTIESISNQVMQPAELLVIDSSSNYEAIHGQSFPDLRSKFKHLRSVKIGSADKRSEGVALAGNVYKFIGYFDDDIVLDQYAIRNLIQALKGNNKLGGVNAMIVNQHYIKPSIYSRLLFRLSGAQGDASNWGGKMFGPVINFLPSDDNNRQDVQEVDWLNTTCVIYRSNLLPDPVFDPHFKGYSHMEDLALSLRVKLKGGIANVQSARIYHDTQAGQEKSDKGIMAEMDLINRYYVIRNVMHRNDFLIFYQLFIQQLHSAIVNMGLFNISYLAGKYRAVKKIIIGSFR